MARFTGTRAAVVASAWLIAGAVLADEPRDFSAELERIRRGYDLPSIAAAAFRDGELLGSGAAGYYSMEHAIPVTTDSRYHLGSCTKAMTAAVVASVVEQGLLSWDTTLPEALPTIEPLMNERYRSVTIRDLLSHRAGIAESANPTVGTLPWTLLAGMGDATPREQREELTKTVLNLAPSADPGASFVYSNFGYIIAALAAETATDQSWEALVRARVFEPLGMTSAGLGPPGEPTTPEEGRVTEPVGHTKFDEWRPMMLLEGRPEPDNPVVFNPAGRVHASVLDWGRFVSDFQQGLDGEGRLLQPATYETLAADPEGDGYALGWGVADAEWARGPVFQHAGSNRMWFAVTWVAPEQDLAIVVALNAATAEARRAAQDAQALFIEAFTFTPAMLEAISQPND